jgi:hypothetical protein
VLSLISRAFTRRMLRCARRLPGGKSPISLVIQLPGTAGRKAISKTIKEAIAVEYDVMMRVRTAAMSDLDPGDVRETIREQLDDFTELEVVSIEIAP